MDKFSLYAQKRCNYGKILILAFESYSRISLFNGGYFGFEDLEIRGVRLGRLKMYSFYREISGTAAYRRCSLAEVRPY